ncbi:hypothetical protein BGX29_007850 [Mortierella sp. GBA35]|nr:hypothetical protein BGX29_007850 [Mortierella sp. GBA35]
MTTRHEALDVPEILRKISSYLPGNAFTACLQTCRSFHTILTPLLYNQLTLVQEEEKRPSVEALKRYVHLVGALKFDLFMSVEYLTVGYKGLHSITMVNQADHRQFQVGSDGEIMEALLVIIRENSALRKWTLFNPWPRLSSDVWRELSSLKKVLVGPDGHSAAAAAAGRNRGVDVLDLTRISVTHEAKHWFLRACADAKELRMLDVAFMYSNGRSDDYQQFLQLEKRPPQGRKVQIVEFSGYNVIDQLTFLSHLVEARHIAWTSPAAGRMPIQTRPLPTFADLEKFVKPTTFPKLRSLDLTGIPDRQLVKFSGECVGYILRCVPENQLEVFRLQGSTFGPRGAEALKRQYPCLQDLRLEPGTIEEQSELIQEVMESCPKLTVLKAGMLSVHHIRKGKPWVCWRLKELAVHVDLETDRAGAVEDKSLKYDEAYSQKYKNSVQYVFELLGRMTDLVELDTSMAYRGPMCWLELTGRYQHPYWRLLYQTNFHLDLLAGLKKLEKLDVSNMMQELEQEDLEMMVRNWPMLKTVSGGLARKPIRHTELAEFLQAKGVQIGKNRY